MLFFGVFRPGGILPVDMIRLVRVVLDRSGKEIPREIAVFGQTKRPGIEDVERKLDIPRGGLPGKFILGRGKRVDILLKEEDVQFLSDSAYADACRPGNPRDTSVEEIKALYKRMM